MYGCNRLAERRAPTRWFRTVAEKRSGRGIVKGTARDVEVVASVLAVRGSSRPPGSAHGVLPRHRIASTLQYDVPVSRGDNAGGRFRLLPAVLENKSVLCLLYAQEDNQRASFYAARFLANDNPREGFKMRKQDSRVVIT